MKVLDFGLAKAMGQESGSGDQGSGQLANSPTITSPAMTMRGVILGTAAYMAPEQARGRTVDKRADIWAFGCVVYEMLTGRMAYGGEDSSLALSKVLQLEPDWSAIPGSTPLHLVDLVKRCLRKDPRERLRDIGDARTELLRDVTPAAAAAVSQTTHPQRAHVFAGLVVGAIAGTLAMWLIGRPPIGNDAAVSRLSVVLPSEAPLTLDYYPGRALAISPDGSEIVYGSGHEGDRLRRRKLDSREALPIPDTVGAQQPFFSPDGAWLGFFSGDGTLKKMPAAGGRPVTVVRDIRAAFWLAGHWSDDGRIVFDNFADNLTIVDADGTNRRTLTVTPGELLLAPIVLPGSRTALFTVSNGDSHHIDAIGLDGANRRTVIDNASQPMFLATGHLLFMRDGDVMVAPFDRDRAEVVGAVNSVGLNVVFDLANNGMPVPQLAVSANGTLAYASSDETGEQRTLDWVDRDGKTLETFTLPFALPYFQLSPDGSALAIMGRRGGTARITVFDLAREAFTDVAELRLDYPSMPLWSLDGRSLIYAKGRRGQAELWSHRLGAPNPDRQILRATSVFWAPSSLTPDGHFLTYIAADAVSGITHSYVLDLQSGDPTKFRALFPSQTANHLRPAISPNGKWIAYDSDETGQAEIYVRQFPDGQNKTRISMAGGFSPRWGPGGKELFFSIESRMMVVNVRPGPQMSFDAPRVLFDRQFVTGIDLGHTWAVAGDGQRFLLMRGGGVLGESQEIVVVQNWFDELRRLAPVTR